MPSSSELKSSTHKTLLGIVKIINYNCTALNRCKKVNKTKGKSVCTFFCVLYIFKRKTHLYTCLAWKKYNSDFSLKCSCLFCAVICVVTDCFKVVYTVRATHTRSCRWLRKGCLNRACSSSYSILLYSRFLKWHSVTPSVFSFSLQCLLHISSFILLWYVAWSMLSLTYSKTKPITMISSYNSHIIFCS